MPHASYGPGGVLFSTWRPQAVKTKEITPFKHILTAHGESLKNNTKGRHVEKISVIGMDPFIIPQPNILRGALLSCDLVLRHA